MHASSLWPRSFAGTLAATLLAVSCHGASVAPPDGGATGGAPNASSTTTTTGTGGSGGAPLDGGGTGGATPEAGCPGDASAADAGADASTGCEGLEGGVSFPSDVAPILAQSCNGELCHTTPTPAKLVGVPTRECCDGRLDVAPGDAAHSYLMDKLTDHDLCDGGSMPLGQPLLADADLLTIRRWICEGAPAQ